MSDLPANGPALTFAFLERMEAKFRAAELNRRRAYDASLLIVSPAQARAADDFAERERLSRILHGPPIHDLVRDFVVSVTPAGGATILRREYWKPRPMGWSESPNRGKVRHGRDVDSKGPFAWREDGDFPEPAEEEYF